MHPIVGNRRSLGLYALVWIPLTALLVYLVRTTGLPTRETAVLVIPLAIVYAVMCLVAWYPCRATPLHSSGLLRLVVTHLAAAMIVSAVWMFVALLYGAGLALLDPFRNVSPPSGLYKNIFGIGVLIYLLWVASSYVLLALERSREADQQAQEASLLARDAELRALKAQINPHFLFNSLHSISALTSVDPLKAREMSILLADFLRSTLGLGEKTLVPLEEEIALIRRFLAVEKVRFGARLQVEEFVDVDAMACLVPPLILQPLVENAVTHGITNLPDGGWVRLTANTGGTAQLTLTVENNFDPDYHSRRKGSGIGMSNVRERVLTRYGKDASFNATIAGDHFRVSMSLPVERISAS